MKTKIFTLLLAVAAGIGMMHAAIVNGTCGDNLTWSLNTKDSTLTITGSGEMSDFGYNNSAPWSDYKSYIAYVSLPEGLTSVGGYAFCACTGLTSVTIPNSVTSIKNCAFYNCSGLTSVTIGNSVTSIGDQAFSRCSGLTSVTIPGSVTSIGERAFEGCSNLQSITIPNNITSVGYRPFYGCDNLTSITVGMNLSNLGSWCFVDCNVNTIHFTGNIEQWCTKTWKPKDIFDVWYETSNKYSLYIGEELITNLIIPNSVTSIGEGAFARCSSLTSVEIPNSVTSIGSSAFSDCNNITSVTISNSVTSIGSKAFANCNKLTTVNIPNTITNIEQELFSGCSKLTAILIPSSVTNIGTYAFKNCNLSTITCEAVTPPTVGSEPFSSYSAILFVPAESVEAYQNALYWEEFTNIRAIGSAPLVQFLDWEGTILSSANVTIGTAATAPADPTRTGYTFIGWDKDYSNITEDLVVTALYEINRYEVIFKDWDETILKTDSVDYNTAATAPANPSHEGHEFIGWDKDFSHVSSDIIINARYAVNYYPVGFLNYDGTLLSEQSIAYNQAAMEPNVPAREGYTFIGWTADIEHITARTFAIALYEKNGINVTYISEEGDTIVSEKVDMHLPDAPIVSGKTFTGWLTESASNAEGIVFRATYTLDNPTTGEDVVVIPTSSTAGVSFPYITGAMTYMLVIRDLFGTVVCKIMFDADGLLLGIAFAPGRNRTQKAQSEGFHFTVEGLTPGTTYEYEFVAYDEADQVIETLSGSFETTADETGVNNISSASAPQKVINDGHVLILRGDKTYTTQGQEVK